MDTYVKVTQRAAYFAYTIEHNQDILSVTQQYDLCHKLFFSNTFLNTSKAGLQSWKASEECHKLFMLPSTVLLE